MIVCLEGIAMALPEIVLMTLVWTVIAGFILFCVLYVLLKPWRDSMGRHVLFFMSAFLLAFIYSTIAPHIPHKWFIHGWIFVIGLIAFVVWWRVILLIKFQIQNHEVLYQIYMKIKNKITKK